MPEYICKCGHTDDEKIICPHCQEELKAKVEKPAKPAKKTKKK